MKRVSALLIFAVAISAMSVACVATAHKIKDSGSIAGTINYPKKPVPSMRVCAFNTETKATSCVKTKAGQTKYSIKALPAAEYYVLANMSQAEFKVGGHMLQVQCIRAPCPALLNSVMLKAKEVKTDIHLNGFYTNREDFPRLPTPKKP